MSKMKGHESSDSDIVISGATGRLPASDNLEEFKENLLNSVDMVTTDDSRWPPGMWNLPERNGKMKNIDRFDAEFFGVPVAEVNYIDPQERLLLECTYEALIDAGVDPKSLKGSRTGFYFGSCFQETHTEFDDPSTTPSKIRSLVTRVSRHFEFKGPLVQTDTACGSSFTALNEAFLALKAGICEQAIVAGSNTLFRPRVSLQFRDLKMVSKDGKCKCLDADANGYVRSEACVVFYLQKRANSKRIYATIINSKSNSDGYKIEGITFPSNVGQRRLVTEVYEEVGIDPSQIEYIEAHVTGTRAGDPVEMDAMSKVICSKRTEPLYVGCLKSNMGHTEGASGLCALAKVCIIYQTGLIPPNLHFKIPNQSMPGLVSGQLKPVTEVIPFDTNGMIPVNCFGFGGANVHVLTKGLTKPHNYVKITDPVPRLIPVAGRTEEGAKFLMESLKRKEGLLTNDFLSLVNDFATIPYEDGMIVRGFMIIRDNGLQNSFEQTEPLKVNPKRFIAVFRGPGECKATFSSLMALPLFSQTMSRLNNSLKRVNLNLLNGHGSATEIAVRTVAIQIGLVDVLTSLSIRCDGLVGCSVGVFGCAYADGCVTADEAILGAYSAAICGGSKDKLRDHLKKVITTPKKRSAKWKSSGSDFASPDYFADHVLVPENGFHEVHADVLSMDFGPNGLQQRGREDNDEAIVTMLRNVGRLYMNGSNPSIGKFYPPVDYPMPSSTPSLSSFLKWNHSQLYPLAPYLIQTATYDFQVSRTIKCHFDRRNAEDSFMFDHKIDGRILFPATGYLMIAWMAFARQHSVTVFECPVEFKDVSFERATVMNMSGETSISVRVNEDNGSFEIKEGDNPVVNGTICLFTRPHLEPLSSKLEPIPSDVVTLGSRDIYKEFRIRGYDYGQYFQGLVSARSDGRAGQIVWRDVISKSFKESMSLETDDDQALLFLRSWTAFVDSMFQLLLMSTHQSTRHLFVPRRLESIVCCPEVFRKNIEDAPKFLDSLTLGEGSFMNAIADPEENAVWVKGLSVKGLQTSLLKRRQQYVRLKRYFFCPFNEQTTLDSEDSIKQVEDYYEDCVSLARRVNQGLTQKEIETNFNLNDDKNALLRLLAYRLQGKAADSMDIDLKNDLLVGSMDNEWYHQEHLLKPHLETLIYNTLYDAAVQKLEVLEYNRSNYILAHQIMSFSDESLLYDQTRLNYFVMHPSPADLDPAQISNVKEVMELDDKAIPVSHLIIFRSYQDDHQDLTSLFRNFYAQTKESGFCLVITKNMLKSPEIEAALRALEKTQYNGSSSEKIIKTAEAVGFHLISHKSLFGSILPLDTILFKKQTIKLLPENQIAFEIGLHDQEQWLPALKEKVKGIDLEEGKRIWITPRFNDPTTDCVTGVLGFVKSIRLEPEMLNVRCLIDVTAEKKVDMSNPKYADVLKKDLVYNMYGGDKLGWGWYEHICLPREIAKDHSVKENVENVYLKLSKPGDLSSFVWVQSNLNHQPKEKVASVYYAPLNFRDIMFATGRLASEAIPGIPPDVAQDSILGLEFAGRDYNGNRVMGIVPYKAIGTTVTISDTDLMWAVPKDWTMEEASTVPCVYATAYYALLIRGNLLKSESVLIHSGAGGVGLAAISICLSRSCTVYTTVGSQRKRDFLLKEFPQLRDRNIFNSRDTRFEEHILSRTNGQGVDVILNSLAEEMLQAGLRCLAPNGRFLEIGKVDFIQNNSLYGYQMDENRSFHGVLLDSLFKYSNNDYFPQRLIDEKKQLQCLVMQGIKDGTVRPLNRTVFEKEQVEEAFRFMASGKHIGKVVLKLREEEADGYVSNLNMSVPAIKVSYMSPIKSYIVIGGLGGFGLEVVAWLADKGAKKIVISGRRGIRETYQQYCINRLAKRGVKIVISLVSLSTSSGAKKVLEVAQEMGPVGGIFNTAVIYDDVLFKDMSLEKFNGVLAPKITAFYHLDVWTRKMCPELDHFVAFSSISCGRGNGGQTNYNFANAAMDSLCEKRHADGLPGLSIQWGVVGDVGIVAEKTNSTEVNLLGATSQRLHSLLDSMDRFLQSKYPVCMSYVKAEKEGNSSGDSVDLLKMVSRIFGLKDISALDPCATLGDLGIDSLIAVEMKQLLERVTGDPMSVKEIRDLKVSTLIELSKSQNKIV